jgi:hypothetical protein
MSGRSRRLRNPCALPLAALTRKLKGFVVARNLALSRVYGIDEETVSDATAFLSPKVSSLYQWWRSLACDGTAAASAGNGFRLPLRREFDVSDHILLVPDLFLVEVLPSREYLMKLEGERVIELFGINNTGRIVSESLGEEDYGHALAEYYRSIVEERRCRRCVGNVDQFNDRRSLRFEAIDCPLSRDGRQVDFIIGVVVGVHSTPL